MSERSARVRRLGRRVRPLLLGVMLAVGIPAGAQELATRLVSWEPRVVLARCVSPDGSLLASARPGQGWQAVAEKEEIHSRDLLLALPGMRAVVETQPRAVELTLWGHLPQWPGFSGLQSAVLLHDSRTFDLDFTLHRGRVIVTNRKDKGEARVWLRLDGAAYQLTLHEPGDAVCLALYGFWPRGVPFTLAPKPEDVPARSLMLMVLKGQVDAKAGGVQHLLSAPPGPAYYHWDLVEGSAEGPRRQDAIPEWANPEAKAPPAAGPMAEVIEKYREQAKFKDPRLALGDLLASAATEADKDRAAAMTEFAVFGLAAINQLDLVMAALADVRQPAARKAAVVALRHWIGDAPGNDPKLYQFLVDRQDYSRAQASTVLQLLHSPFAAEEPDSYEILIAYMRHEKLAVRELAWWHLSRLVPADLRAPYDPAAPDAERTKAQAAWKALIPSGTVPMRPKKK
jgi:hypothetical protein